MNKAELSEFLAFNIDKIKDVKRYKNILDRGNNLIRFDCINRTLIELQCNNAFDIRTYDEWQAVGRNIIKRDNVIYIAIPSNKTSYIDTETGNVINDSDLNANEIPFALKYGIIKKEQDIESLSIIPVFDIRNTYCSDNSNYKVEKRKLSSSMLINMIVGMTGCKVEDNELFYYSESKNTLYVAKQSYSELASNTVEFLLKYYIKKLREQFSNENEFELAYNSLQYSLTSLLHTDSQIDLDIISKCSTESILSILNTIDTIIVDLIQYIGFDNSELNTDISKKLLLDRKASALLNLMEANEEYRRLKGK